MDQTFLTMHDLTSSAKILFVSDSIFDVLGYQPEEVLGKSSFEFFHPDEVLHARYVHKRSILLERVAVLHYARIQSRDGCWLTCECCFTVVYDVLVATTRVYHQSEARRALEAPQICRFFSCSSRDPNQPGLWNMLQRSDDSRVMRHEPRAALILNRFTRSLSIMYATSGVEEILGLSPEQLQDRSFYDYVQEGCLDDAVDCFEGAKAQDSIAFLPLQVRRSMGAGTNTVQTRPCSLGVDAVVSCTSDGLVVIMRRAKPQGKSYWYTHGVNQTFATMLSVRRTSHAQRERDETHPAFSQVETAWEAMGMDARSKSAGNIRDGFLTHDHTLTNAAGGRELDSVQDLCCKFVKTQTRLREQYTFDEDSRRRRRARRKRMRLASCVCNEDCERLWGSCPTCIVRQGMS